MGTGKRLILWLLIWSASLPISLSGQIGGDRAFSFLHLSPSARITGLGTVHPAVIDDDPMFAWQNPAILNPSTHQSLHFNHSFFPAGIQHGSAMYAHSLRDSSWHMGIGIQYVNYADFTLTDEGGVEMGTFDASDLAFIFSASRQVHKNYRIGANIKYVNSHIESYSASALLLDLGVHYQLPERRINISLTAKNMGVFLGRFSEYEQQYNLPFDLVLGFSKKLEHLPFRYGIAFHHLYRWNVSYDDPNQENNTLFGALDPDTKSPSAVDNFFRHINFNGEFLLGKRENFRLRIAYSHLLRQELKLSNVQTLAGFSFGLGLKVSRFRIDYGRSVYHLAGGIHHLSISTRLGEFF